MCFETISLSTFDQNTRRLGGTSFRPRGIDVGCAPSLSAFCFRTECSDLSRMLRATGIACRTGPSEVRPVKTRFFVPGIRNEENYKNALDWLEREVCPALLIANATAFYSFIIFLAHDVILCG